MDAVEDTVEHNLFFLLDVSCFIIPGDYVVGPVFPYKEALYC